MDGVTYNAANYELKEFLKSNMDLPNNSELEARVRELLTKLPSTVNCHFEMDNRQYALAIGAGFDALHHRVKSLMDEEKSDLDGHQILHQSASSRPGKWFGRDESGEEISVSHNYPTLTYEFKREKFSLDNILFPGICGRGPFYSKNVRLRANFSPNKSDEYYLTFQITECTPEHPYACWELGTSYSPPLVDAITGRIQSEVSNPKKFDIKREAQERLRGLSIGIAALRTLSRVSRHTTALLKNEPLDTPTQPF